MSQLSVSARALPIGAAAILATFLIGVAASVRPVGAQQPGSTSAPGDSVLTLSLSEAIGRAHAENRELETARLALREADAQVREAWGSVMPRIDLNARYTRNLTPPSAFFPAIFFDETAPPDELIRVSFGADNTWNTTVSFEQTLFEGRAFIGVGAASRFRGLHEEIVRGRALEISTRIRLLYYDLLLAREQARLTERSVERVLQSLEETRALNRAGLASDYDVLRLEVELANLEPQLRRATNDARARERELATELDLPPGVRVEVQGDLSRLDVEDAAANDGANREIVEQMGPTLPSAEDEIEVQALLGQLRDGSSLLRQAELNGELRRAELRAAQSEFLPRISLFGTYLIDAQHDGRPTFFGEPGQRGYGRMVGIQLSLPIFTGRQRIARVEQQRAAHRSAQVEMDQASARLEDQLRSLLEALDEAVLTARGQRLAVRQAERGYQIASAQYREGLGSQLELTDAEVALRQSEFNYAGAVFDFLATRARLDELLGVGPLPGIDR